MELTAMPKLTRQHFQDIDDFLSCNSKYTQEDREVIIRFVHDIFELEKDEPFRQGEMVECIDDKDCQGLQKGNIYKVEAYNPTGAYGNEIPTLDITFEHYGIREGTFYSKRFKKHLTD